MDEQLTDFLPGEHNGYRLDVDKLEAWADRVGDTPDGLAAADFVEFVMSETGETSGVLVTTDAHLADYFRHLAEEADEVSGSVKEYAATHPDFWDGYCDAMSGDCARLYYLGDREDDTTFDDDWTVLAPL